MHIIEIGLFRFNFQFLYFLKCIFTLKKPIITTLLSSINVFASSTEVNSLAAGPVFFKSQLTISSACLPPKNKTMFN